MFGTTLFSSLSSMAVFTFVMTCAAMFWACLFFVGWANPFRWIAMWMALALGGFVIASLGLIGRGASREATHHFWEPSLLGLVFAAAIASAGTVGVWRSNRGC